MIYNREPQSQQQWPFKAVPLKQTCLYLSSMCAFYAVFFSFLVLQMPCSIKWKPTLPLANISLCPSKTSLHCIIQHIRQSQTAELNKPAFCKLCCLPLPFLLTTTLYLHAIFTPDMGLYCTDKKMRPSGFWFLCFLLDLRLINNSLFGKSIYKVVFDDKWELCKQRCGKCKWLCVWCATRSQVRYHMGGCSHVLETE